MASSRSVGLIEPRRGASQKSLPDVGRAAPPAFELRNPIWLHRRSKKPVVSSSHQNSIKHDKHAQAMEHVKRAQYYFHAHEYEKALRAVDAAIELVPRAPGLLMERGQLYRKLGRWTDAIADYSNAKTLEEKQAQEAAMLVRAHSRGSPTKRPSGSVRLSSSQMTRPLTASASVPATVAAPAGAPAGAAAARPFSASCLRERGSAASQSAAAAQGHARTPSPPAGDAGEAEADEVGEEEADDDASPRPPPAGASSSAEGDGGEAVGGGASEDDPEEEGAGDAPAPAAAPAASSEFDVEALSALGRMSGGGLADLSADARASMLSALAMPPEERQVEHSAYLSACLKGVPVLAKLPDDSRLKLCTSARLVEVEEGTLLRAADGGGGGGTPGGGAPGGGAPGGGVGGSGSSSRRPSASSLGLYVVLYGEVRVTRPPGGTHTLCAGDHFGDIDLLHKSLRHAEIVSAEPCGLLAVDADDFRRVLQRSHLEEAAERAIFIASVPMFHKLPWERLLRMVSLFEPRQYRHGETIVQQGETPLGVFVIFDGRCTVQREIEVADGGRRRIKPMRLETLMPRDTYGGDAVLHGASRSQTSLVAETDCKLLFMPRADFSPAHLTEEAMRMLKLNAKLYRPDDDMLLRRHFEEQEWEHAKKHYVRQVMRDAHEQRKGAALLSRNPAMMRRSSERHPLFS